MGVKIDNFVSKFQDASHLTGNSTLQGARWKSLAASTGANAIGGSLAGGVIGGGVGAFSDDSTALSGFAKGAAIGAGLGATANLGMAGYGRHLGKSDYTYKTSIYTAAGILPGTTVKANTNVTLGF